VSTPLQRLVGQAAWIAGMSPCDCMGHLWVSDGARGCPHSDQFDRPCSQPVYVCDRCGTYDYGEKGGPGHADCESGACCGGEAWRNARRVEESEVDS
jgi:hypothetical protein